MRSFKTPKGTELPISLIKGKEYLQVAPRVVWFREEHPTWSIQTEFIESTASHAVAKATIIDDKGRPIATAHKHEDKQGFGDYREKAETGAVGRALALCGYGTMFATELEEGERIVDAPIASISKAHYISMESSLSTTPGNKKETMERMIDHDQAKIMFRIGQDNGWTATDIQDWLCKNFSITSSKEISISKYNLLCEHMKKHPKKQNLELINDD